MISDPRSYPGYPTWRLARVRPRRWTSLDRTLAARRSQQKLGNEFPSHARLSRLLYFAHGVNAARGRGPVPSAGGLQALELYLVNFTPCWLPAGLYHYDRAAFPDANRTRGGSAGVADARALFDLGQRRCLPLDCRW